MLEEAPMPTAASARWSRRCLLLRLGRLAAAVPLALSVACRPSPPAEPAPAGQAAPASAARGKLSVWFNASWNEVTNRAVGDLFAEWGRKNGVEIDSQALSGGQHEKIAAAIAAGQPPEIMQTQTAYWRKQGELVETTPVVRQMQAQGSGLFPVAERAVTYEDGKHWAVPWGINGWPIHARRDLWERGGSGFPKTWDEFGAVAASIQQPPRTYGFGLATGLEGDATDNFVNLMWSFGARLADEHGAPALDSSGTVEALRLVRKWFVDLKIIPPESLSATLTAWNNEAYQKGRALAIINPTTVYGWLVVNDQDLLERTGLYALPAGPAGSFTQVDVWDFAVFRRARNADRALEALAYFVEPERYEAVIGAVQGRFVPVYRDLTKTDFWTTNAEFREMIKVAQTGRTSSYAGPPMPWFAQMVNQHVISTMIRRVVQDGEDPAAAVSWAHGEVWKAYEQSR
jgi:multiple sugar transport system substrate-binding protein